LIQVFVGQAATLRFAAFNQKTTPEIEGEITVVAADITQEQRTGVSY
jgi:HlyD family secretion protein